MAWQWLCSGFRVPLKIQKKLRKLLKQMLNHGTYQLAADDMTGGWSHDQFANRVKKKEKTQSQPYSVASLMCLNDVLVCSHYGNIRLSLNIIQSPQQDSYMPCKALAHTHKLMSSCCLVHASASSCHCCLSTPWMQKASVREQTGRQVRPLSKWWRQKCPDPKVHPRSQSRTGCHPTRAARRPWSKHVLAVHQELAFKKLVYVVVPKGMYLQ